jgi:uncharacterized caspase-like protein
MIAAVLAGLACSRPVQAAGPEICMHYLAVGVSSYPHLSRLKNAHKDAQSLGAFLSRQTGTLYRESSGEVLIEDRATRANTLAALDRISARAQAGDVFVFSLSGHGGVHQGQWTFCTYDFDPRQTGINGLPAGLLADKLKLLARREVTVVLIIDACFSGASNIQNAGAVVFASCDDVETSSDGLPQWNNGLFSKAMLEGLSGAADLNKDGTITLVELDAYVSARMEELSRQFGGAHQHSTCGRPSHIRSGLVLFRCRQHAPATTQYTGPETSMPPHNAGSDPSPVFPRIAQGAD